MLAVFDQPAALNGDDSVGAAHRRQAVSDDEHGAPFGDLIHVLLNHALALVIERARRLIEDEDAWIADQCARDRDALALPAREARAALADDGVIAFGQFQDEVLRARKRRRCDDPLHRYGRVRERNIVAHRSIEQNVLLQHDAHLPA